MNNRPNNEEIDPDDFFPDSDSPRAKSSVGSPIISDEKIKIEPKIAPDGFQYVFGYDNIKNRYGYLLTPTIGVTKEKNESDDKADEDKSAFGMKFS